MSLRRNYEQMRLPLWTTRTHTRPLPRLLATLLKVALPAFVLGLVLALTVWDPHVELAFYSRSWVRQQVRPVPPLAGCFAPARVSPLYNATDALYAPHRTTVHAGMPLRLGMDCYNFAGLIHPPEDVAGYRPPDERLQYHTYWRTDLVPFGERQEWMLKSFFATQNLNVSRLVLWSNGDLSNNAFVQQHLQRYPDAFTSRVADVATLSAGTALEGAGSLWVEDGKAWVDGDLLRLLVLWQDGGVWVDMDSLLTRDLRPLVEHEFVTQWDCYDKVYVPFNGALMHFRQHSPYLCEAFHIMASSPAPRKGSTDWGATLYLKLWRRLTAAGVPPFSVLPFCFADGRSCRLDNRLPDPFAPDPRGGAWTDGMGRERGGGLDQALGKVFSVHLHNQWEKAFPPDGWVHRLLLSRYEQRLGGE
ncbi:glycosyltransferase family-like protein [Phanerochaete sordida]|uniref:Glycosyltransferase family-like protein n=1 Tax=Phanerochaete sordida TaxID=48140 RepID=A0A9P3LGS1_9APHY|nr:glycosyltransferase family-like protein [Phanerochaete sordida]